MDPEFTHISDAESSRNFTGSLIEGVENFQVESTESDELRLLFLRAGYSIPARRQYGLMIWTWLKWQLDRDINAIRTRVDSYLGVAEQLHRLPVTLERGKHDLYLLLNCIISGDSELMNRAARTCWFAGPAVPSVLLASLTGVLKFRILGDAARSQEQYEIYLGARKSKLYHLPGRALLARFVDRNYRSFGNQLAKECEKYNTYARQEWMAYPESIYETRLVFDLRKIRGQHPWPYFEAALAKLSVLDGAKLTYDSVWLPKAFTMQIVGV